MRGHVTLVRVPPAAVLLGAALGAAVLLAAPPAGALPDSTWVIAIGHNRGDMSEVRLLYAERDAREVADVLRTEGRVSSNRLRVLLDEDADTVRRAIVEVNGAIRDALQAGPRSTALVIFYSGHADAEALHLGGTRLAMQELRGLVQGSAASLRLLVVDACRSGGITRVKGLVEAPEFVVDLDSRLDSEGVAIISSSAAGESSQETDRLRGSFFTHHLVSGLRGAADRDGDGQVTLGEAFAYTSAQTVRSSSQTLALQHPTYSYDVRGRSDVVLTTPGVSQRRSGRLRLLESTAYLIADGRQSGPVVAEVSPPRARAVLALPEGRYFVQQRQPREYREFSVAIAAGQEVDLATLPYRAVRYDQLVRRRGGARESVHGVTILGGVSGGLVPGEPPLGSALVGYSADLPWLSVGLRLRGAGGTFHSSDGGVHTRHLELGAGLLLSRMVDTPALSLGFGLTVEGIYHMQRFVTERAIAPRDSFGPAFGLLLAVERHLWQGLALRVEGGPLALLTSGAVVQSGVQTGQSIQASITGWGALGMVWRK